jgi:hypothetical protein
MAIASEPAATGNQAGWVSTKPNTTAITTKTSTVDNFIVNLLELDFRLGRTTKTTPAGVPIGIIFRLKTGRIAGGFPPKSLRHT